MNRVDEPRRRRFEAARLASDEVRIEDFLPERDEETYAATLEELVLIDLELRHKAWRKNGGGPAPAVADYAERFPALADPAARRRLEREVEWLDGTPSPGRIDRYLVRERIGEGAFADVWRAHDPKLERDVALKIPKVALSGDAPLLERVRREASAAARLDHPGIVSVYAVGEHEGRPFYASEFVSGPTLAQRFRDAPVAPDEAAGLVAQVCDAVAYAHDVGVIHRDIKPSNILMHPVRGPVLTDFGLAQLGSAANVLTREGDLLGTPAYMAPEQARGATPSIDARTDVYALGVVLYEGLTGTRPFDRSSTAATVQAVLADDPPPTGKDVPLDLETICLKAMAREPDRRYGSARALADDLRRYLGRLPIAARRMTPAGRVALWMRRRPGMTALGGAALLAVSVALAWGYLGIRQERDQLREEQANTKRNLRRALVSDAQAIVAARRSGWPEQALARVRNAAVVDTPGDVVTLRDLAIECLTTLQPTLSEVARFRPTGGPAVRLAVDAAGVHAATATEAGVLELRELASGTVLRSAPFARESLCGLRMHPSGTALVLAYEGGRLELWSTAPLARRKETQTAPITAIALHPKGDVLAVARKDGRVELRGLTAAGLDDPLRVLQAHEGAAHAVAFSNDGKRLATGGEDNHMRLWNWRWGRCTRDAAEMPAAVKVVAATSGNHAAYLCAGASDVTWSPRQVSELDTGVRVYPAAFHGAPIGWLAYVGGSLLCISVDGSMSVLARETGATSLIDPCHASRVLAAAVVAQTGEVVTSHADGMVIRRRVGGAASVRSWRAHHACTFRAGTHELVTDSSVFRHARNGLDALPFESVSYAALVVDARRRELIGVSKDGVLVRHRETPPYETLGSVPTGLAGATGLAVRGDRLLAGAEDGRAWLGSFENGGWRGALRDLERGAILEVAWAGRPARALALTEAGLMRIDPAGGVTTVDAEAGRALAANGDHLVWSRGFGEIVLQGGETRRSLDGHEHKVLSVCLSPDGSRLASADRSELFVRELPGGRLVKRTPLDHVTRLRFGDDDRLLVCSMNFGVLDLAAERWTGRSWAGLGRDAAMCSSGRTVFQTHGVAGLCAWPSTALAKAGTPTLDSAPWLPATHQVTSAGHGHAVWGVATSPDGRWFATCDHLGAVKLFDAATRRLASDLREGDGELSWRVAFSSDSRLLAAGAGEIVDVYDVKTCERVARLAGHEKLVVALSFHPSERHLVSTAADVLKVWDVEGGRLLATHRLPAVARDVAHHPSGAEVAIAYRDGRVGIYDAMRIATSLEALAALPAHPLDAAALAYNRAGTLLATGGAEGRVALYDAETRTRLCSFPMPVNVRTISFSHDDSWLAATSYAAGGRSWDLVQIRGVLRELDIDWD